MQKHNNRTSGLIKIVESLTISEKNKKPRNPLNEWYRQNTKTLFKNLTYRIAFLVLCVAALGGLLALLQYAVALVSGWANQFFVLVYFLLGLYLIISYAFKSFNQMLSEFALSASIFYLRKEIERLKKPKEVQDLNALQVRINKVRSNLKDLINLSEIRTPPIYNYELSRLQKGIDIFFNSTSEVLFPTQQVFSEAEKIEQQQTLAYYQAEEHPTVDELAEEFEEAQKLILA